MITNNVRWLEDISKEDQKKYNASDANVHVVLQEIEVAKKLLQLKVEILLGFSNVISNQNIYIPL